MRPILFHIGPVPIRAYGLLIVIGFLVALRYVLAQLDRLSRELGQDGARRQGLPTKDQLLDMALIGLALGIVGTRVVFVALHWEMFRDNPLDILRIWTGGLSFIGGPLFGFAFVWWYARRYGLSFRRMADLASPGFALAYAFGRVGCFLNGCCYGHACSLPWAVRFHVDGFGDALTPPSHPTQLYASAMSLGIFAVLHRLLRTPHRPGQVAVAYFALYACYRFVNDFFRAGATSRVVAFGLTDGQVAALIAIPVLAILWFRLRRPEQPGSASAQ